ncbi:MAG: PorT family protein [Proteiniphilum sp.]|nr:PorT family protein [Proteiniphilum sp.]
MILACLSIMMTAGLATVNAQTPVSFGVKQETNFSNFLLSGLGRESSKMRPGPSLGGFVNFGLSQSFSIQPEVMLFYRQSLSKAGPVSDTFRQWGMQVPVYFMGQTPTSCGKFYAGVGPYLGVGFNAKYKHADHNLYKKYHSKAAMNRWDFGFGVMVGHEFFNSMQINAGYQVGVVDQLDAFKKSASKRTQTLSVGLGYRF